MAAQKNIRFYLLTAILFLILCFLAFVAALKSEHQDNTSCMSIQQQACLHRGLIPYALLFFAVAFPSFLFIRKRMQRQGWKERALLIMAGTLSFFLFILVVAKGFLFA